MIYEHNLIIVRCIFKEGKLRLSPYCMAYLLMFNNVLMISLSSYQNEFNRVVYLHC